jgi:cytochrome c oxidase assembly factor CtaG
MRLALLAALLWLAAAPAWAHVAGFAHSEPGWSLAPWVLIPVLASLALYGVGALRLARRSGPGRELLARRSWLFAAGWLALALAVLSPLHEAGERSFTLHMVEHEVLMLAAAPLLVLSRPLGAMVWAFPLAARRALGGLERRAWVRGPWRALTEPVTATLIQAAALWIWHMPSLFDLALSVEGWHAAQHLSFLVSALLFWSAMLERRSRGGVGLAAICLFATSIIAGALGALMAFAQGPWYARYAALGMAPFGLTPTEDQQLAGLLMWIPGGMVHAVAALALVAGALGGRPATSPLVARDSAAGRD